MPVRILFLADTHVGFDLPLRPRIDRPRRGEDFLANYRKALEPALQGGVDCVVHGGDLLYRSKVPQQLVYLALQPLREVADSGVPVFLVPGNHERSTIPYPLLASHPNIHLFSRPKTIYLELRGQRVAFAGFPNVRNSIASSFSELVDETAWDAKPADAAILCIHQTVEGATVGPSEFVFRRGDDIIPGQAIPAGFLAVLSGHIHRAQILIRGLDGRPLGAPVFYPGSVERTSFAERDETKGYFILEIARNSGGGARIAGVSFQELPARPMFRVAVGSDPDWEKRLAVQLRQMPENAVVQIELGGRAPVPAGFTSTRIRALAPSTLVVSLRFKGQRQ